MNYQVKIWIIHPKITRPRASVFSFLLTFVAVMTAGPTSSFGLLVGTTVQLNFDVAPSIQTSQVTAGWFGFSEQTDHNPPMDPVTTGGFINTLETGGMTVSSGDVQWMGLQLNVEPVESIYDLDGKNVVDLFQGLTMQAGVQSRLVGDLYSAFVYGGLIIEEASVTSNQSDGGSRRVSTTAFSRESIATLLVFDEPAVLQSFQMAFQHDAIVGVFSGDHPFLPDTQYMLTAADPSRTLAVRLNGEVLARGRVGVDDQGRLFAGGDFVVDGDGWRPSRQVGPIALSAGSALLQIEIQSDGPRSAVVPEPLVGPMALLAAVGAAVRMHRHHPLSR